MSDAELAKPTATPDSISPRLRISKVLERCVADEGSYKKLAAAIQAAIPDLSDKAKAGAPRAIDRRKLAAIVKNDPNLVFSIGELRALDHYLEQRGQGLAYNPFFEKPDVVRCLADSGRIVFLIGSKPDEDRFRINISHWDFLGLNHIQSGILGCSQGVQIDTREVRMPKGLSKSKKRDPLEDLFSPEGPSLGVLGSTISTTCAEWMLCGMARQERFKPLAAKERLRLPFHFVWPESRKALPSAFHLDAKDVAKESADAADLLKGGVCLLRHSGVYLPDDLTRGRDKGKTYALCAAQRRGRNQIWLLVAGLTGPATAAGAKWVEKMGTTLYDTSRTASPVFWNIVKADAEKKGDSFEVGEPEYEAGGEAWG